MNWLRRLILFLMGKFQLWLQKTVVVTENINISWADFLDNKKASILVYTAPGCDLCDEIELFFKNSGVAYKAITCKIYIPYRRLNQPGLKAYIGFRARDGKHSKQLFLPPAFPQVDFISVGGAWERIVGDVQAMRDKTEEFVSERADSFPGFEAGVVKKKSPAEQASKQVEDIFRRMKNGHDN